jgi:hypothetical protein
MKLDSDSVCGLGSIPNISSFQVETCMTHGDSHVVAGSEDGSVYFWDLIEGDLTRPLIEGDLTRHLIEGDLTRHLIEGDLTRHLLDVILFFSLRVSATSCRAKIRKPPKPCTPAQASCRGILTCLTKPLNLEPLRRQGFAQAVGALSRGLRPFIPPYCGQALVLLCGRHSSTVGMKFIGSGRTLAFQLVRDALWLFNWFGTHSGFSIGSGAFQLVRDALRLSAR